MRAENVAVLWRVKKGSDRRFRSGHPWIFSSELDSSSKSLPAGHLVQLVDAKGNFLALGYGSPQSLIAFRSLTRKKAEAQLPIYDLIADRLRQAWAFRVHLGERNSFRWVYSEADELPGLIVDRYLTSEGEVLVAQVLTAGMDKLLTDQVLQDLLCSPEIRGKTSDGFVQNSRPTIVVRKDAKVRKLEGLEVVPPYVLGKLENIQEVSDKLRTSKVLLSSSLGQNLSEGSPLNQRQPVTPPTEFWADLLEGQKTGFFLDQAQNIRSVVQLLARQSWQGRRLRILDLCCYTGHWSTQIAAAFAQHGTTVEVTLVDVSEAALVLAQKNVEAYASTVVVQKQDVMELKVESAAFDLVIADPPAFVKNRRDLEVGLHAYQKLNRLALAATAPGGLLVSCSCSGLVSMEDLREALADSVLRDGRQAKCVLMSGHGPDHPVRWSFPEGFYLKMLVHAVPAST